ncbi:hypothetical protein L1887_06328 [Cichorium endivia]|nr:hypothetical protein L1887_06328 [Cichorium endivia]
MSGVWTGPNVTGGRSPRLQPMVDYLVALGRTLEKRESSSGTTLARRLKKMLVESYDEEDIDNGTFDDVHGTWEEAMEYVHAQGFCY